MARGGKVRNSTVMFGVKARRMPPTQRHRLAITPGILGTVYARNEAGVERYFDYDWKGAMAYAGVRQDRDPRVAPERPGLKRKALYILREAS